MGAHNRRVRALNGNLLDARKRDLQTVSRSDISILNRGRLITKLAGVHRAEPPCWLKSDCIFHASISVGGTKLHLGSFKTQRRRRRLTTLLRSGCRALSEGLPEFA
jgi:hypothetical protein